eukprot:3037547-Rhodomonas_salina.4
MGAATGVWLGLAKRSRSWQAQVPPGHHVLVPLGNCGWGKSQLSRVRGRKEVSEKVCKHSWISGSSRLDSLFAGLHPRIVTASDVKRASKMLTTDRKGAGLVQREVQPPS